MNCFSGVLYRIPLRTAGWLTLMILAAAAMFHIIALLGFVPMEYAWGGKIKDKNAFFVMEGISLSVVTLLITAVIFRTGMRSASPHEGWPRIIFGIFAAVFALNTVGNLFAETLAEKIAGGAGTLVLTLLTTRLAMKSQYHRTL